MRPETPDTAEYERSLADESVVSPEAREIVRRASALEPSARYQSAAALAAALGGEKDVAPAASFTVPPTFEPAPRKRGWVKVLLAVMAAVAFVAAVLIILVQTLGAGAPAEKDVDVDPVAEEPAASAPVPDDEPAGGDAPATVAADLEIVESGWSVGSDGYVYYAFGGRDEAGKVLFSEEQILNIIGAGETNYFGSLVGGGEAPAAVEFEPLPIEDYQVGLTGSEVSFSVSSVSVSSGRDGMTSFTGDVTTVDDDGQGIGSDVALTVVLRDESGAIVYGMTDYARKPPVGESTSFEVERYGVPDYATYEVHAQAW